MRIGDISKQSAILLMSILFVSGMTLMATLSFIAFGVLCGYISLNIGYIYYLKQIPILDVTIIAIGFVLRLFVGSTITEIHLSIWVILLSFLLALFMALAKRRDDVHIFLNTGQKMRRVTDSYNLKFIDGAMIIMASVVIVSHLLYTTSIEVMQRMHSENIYLTTLFVILGIMRYLQITFVGNDSSSPTRILLKDKFIQSTILAWLFAFTWIIYI